MVKRDEYTRLKLIFSWDVGIFVSKIYLQDMAQFNGNVRSHHLSLINRIKIFLYHKVLLTKSLSDEEIIFEVFDIVDDDEMLSCAGLNKVSKVNFSFCVHSHVLERAPCETLLHHRV